MKRRTKLSRPSPRTSPSGDSLVDAVTRVRDLGANPKLPQIRLVVARASGFTPAELVPDDRHRSPASARTTIMILATIWARCSMGQIGQLLKRHHTTVFHALRKRDNCGLIVDTVRNAFLNEAPNRVDEITAIEIWRRLRPLGHDHCSRHISDSGVFVIGNNTTLFHVLRPPITIRTSTRVKLT
jgi:Bacterial dnaA protein helix-turn-helix